ncbi:MAG: tRNA uridine-5-carboxymethylaminomethyl(34) synthesis enzyme MnmG [Fidelibacterota bacterium]
MKSPTIVIAGAGHAGLEAAYAVSRMGGNAILVTMDTGAIGRASCNPAIGGLAKGHLVKEIDALGGMMGRIADLAGIQFKMLNRSKGRAVWSPRAQIDKVKYSQQAFQMISAQQNVTILADEVVDFSVNVSSVVAAVLKDGSTLPCDGLIITAGTFLNGLIHIGSKSFKAGRFGEQPSIGLSESFIRNGFKIGRLKTGTPPRIHRNSIDWGLTEESCGDKNPVPFSALTPTPFNPKNIACNIVHTNPNSHDILKDNIELSAMYSGKISGVGPRYCPSIEDKIIRFSDRDQHQLYLEPEWVGSHQIYVNGFSTSMPEFIQLETLRTIPALKNVELIRPGYAIEYDYCFSSQLKSSLESKAISGLFFAGQVNGTSGYEEAAAQGLIAGINAVSKIKNDQEFILTRQDGYIGVLIDDLITKDINEPYRMFTSSAEFRLSFRPDNADLRLTEKGAAIGCVPPERVEMVLRRGNNIDKIKSALSENKVRVSVDLKKRADDYLKQNGVSIADLQKLIPVLSEFNSSDLFTAETDIKYSGYLEREKIRMNQMKNIEDVIIPANFDYRKINNLSNEAREKLGRIQPQTLGQASRIAGVSPSDIFAISVRLR